MPSMEIIILFLVNVFTNGSIHAPGTPRTRRMSANSRACIIESVSYIILWAPFALKGKYFSRAFL